MKHKILVVVGTRPEAIKLAPLIIALRARSNFEAFVCCTGQHPQLVAKVFQDFGIKNDIELEVFKQGQTLPVLFSKITIGIEALIKREMPKMVIVHGDTATTAAAAICAFNCKIPVVHVEAGLRSGDLDFPWPEEGNRKLVSAIAHLHLAPTDIAKQNLKLENIAHEKIKVTGNTVIDAIRLIMEKVERKEIEIKLVNNLKKIILEGQRYILVTCHRRENQGSGVDNLIDAIKTLAGKYGKKIVMTVHPNPELKAIIEKELLGYENVVLLPPLDYPTFTYLMSKSHIILTDSGGIQEEAPYLGIPTLVLRSVTERPEVEKLGAIKLVGSTKQSIVENVLKLEDEKVYRSMQTNQRPYGNGYASEAIVKEIGVLL